MTTLLLLCAFLAGLAIGARFRDPFDREIDDEIARAESTHGRLGATIPEPPSAALFAAGHYLEATARADLDAFPSVAAIFAEEAGEVLTAATTADRRAELVQVAAVCKRWVELIDRRA